VWLPSEAEWEWAARGETGRIYPWGDAIDVTRANYGDTGLHDTSAVGCFPAGATPEGVEELSGTIWEWTRSKGWPYPYIPADGREDLAGDWRRVVRGGSFSDDPRFVRCAYRGDFGPGLRSSRIGFRLVLSSFRSGTSSSL
jgi:formylglycine-generating enzyme required for sulfatase activity